MELGLQDVERRFAVPQQALQLIRAGLAFHELAAYVGESVIQRARDSVLRGSHNGFVQYGGVSSSGDWFRTARTSATSKAPTPSRSAAPVTQA